MDEISAPEEGTDFATTIKVTIELVGGLLISLVVAVLTVLRGLPTNIVFMVSLFNILFTITLLFYVPFVGITYLFGSLLGLWILLNNGAITIVQFLFYMAVMIAMLLLRMANPFKDLK